MAGHSKWANIRRHKAKQDAKRDKLYTKLLREITVAAKMGEIASNPRLRAAVEKAQEANMTKDVIDRAIKRGAGGSENSEVEEISYEGYGPSGIAILVECMTNNRNRTVGEVRHAFVKYGGNLGTTGSVAYLFKKRGFLLFSNVNEDLLLETALEAGAEDVIVEETKTIKVLTPPEQFLTVKEKLTKAQLKAEEAEITMVPNLFVEIKNKEEAERIMNLIEMLEDLDDVQAVYTNADIMDEAISV